MRLNKYIANHNVASRRKADELIEKGRVLVNGNKAQLGQQVTADDQITVNGKNLPSSVKPLYYLLHKPTGYLSTAKDDQDRRTVLDLVPNKSRLYPVGRLDYDSEGLMLLTNDGELTYHLTHPKFQVEKVYKVLVKGLPSAKRLDQLRNGVMVDGKKTAPAQVEIIQKQPDRTWLEFTLHEGKNRQIRKMCHKISHPVVRLIRLKLGPYSLGELKPGEYQETTNKL